MRMKLVLQVEEGCRPQKIAIKLIELKKFGNGFFVPPQKVNQEGEKSDIYSYNIPLGRILPQVWRPED